MAAKAEKKSENIPLKKCLDEDQSCIVKLIILVDFLEKFHRTNLITNVRLMFGDEMSILAKLFTNMAREAEMKRLKIYRSIHIKLYKLDQKLKKNISIILSLLLSCRTQLSKCSLKMHTSLLFLLRYFFFYLDESKMNLFLDGHNILSVCQYILFIMACVDCFFYETKL